MDSTALLATFRNELHDLVDPFLWSDDEVFGYIDDAQRWFCRLVEGIGDGSSALTRLSVAPVTTLVNGLPVTVAAPEWVAVSPLILKFRDAYDSMTGRQLPIVNYEDLASSGIRFNGRTAMKPEALVIGIEPGRARIYPAPTIDSVGFIQLIVDRLPLRSIDDADQKLEIAEQHHVKLLMWMKHRAYAKQDADTYDAKKSNDFRQEFEAYCAFSKHEKERAKSKVRIMAYGGIGMGSARYASDYRAGGGYGGGRWGY